MFFLVTVFQHVAQMRTGSRSLRCQRGERCGLLHRRGRGRGSGHVANGHGRLQSGPVCHCRGRLLLTGQGTIDTSTTTFYNDVFT